MEHNDRRNILRVYYVKRTVIGFNYLARIRIVKSILFYFTLSKVVSSIFGYGFDFKRTYVTANKRRKIYYFFVKKFDYFHYWLINRVRAQLL